MYTIFHSVYQRNYFAIFLHNIVDGFYVFLDIFLSAFIKKKSKTKIGFSCDDVGIKFTALFLTIFLHTLLQVKGPIV